MAKMLAKSQLTLHENSDLEVASSSTSRTAAPISPQGTTSATRLSGSPDIDPISVALDSVLNSNRAPTTPNRPTTNSISPQSRVTQNLVQNNPDQTLMHNATPGRPTTPVFTTRNPSTAYPPRVNRLMNRLDSLDLANIAAELTSEEENCTKIESMIASFRRGMESFTRLNELSIFLSDRSKKQE